MKKLIVLLLLCISFTGYSQDSCRKVQIISQRYDDSPEQKAGRIAVDLVQAYYDLQGENTGGDNWQIAKDIAIYSVRQLKKIYNKNDKLLDLVIKNIKALVYD